MIREVRALKHSSKQMAGLLLLCACFAAICCTFYADSWKHADAKVAAPVKARIIAHAGGGFRGRTYLNCREAIDHNYSMGYRLFELDFSWTTDGDLVLLHDWNRTLKSLFVGKKGQLSREEFVSAEMVDGLTQMTLDDLVQWLRFHPDAYVITDVKHRNVYGLTLIGERAGKLRDRFIPQFYYPVNSGAIVRLGYENLIFTNYRAKLSKVQLLELVRLIPLYALTVPHQLAKSPGFSSALANEGVSVYAHTINTESEFNELIELGNYGVYSDWLSPKTLLDR